MIQNLFTLARTVMELAEDVRHYRAELVEIRKDLRDLTELVNGLAQEMEHNKQDTYLKLVTSPSFIAEFPPSLRPEEFVDRLAERRGKSLTQPERTQLINELTTNYTAAGRAIVVRKIDEKHG